MDIGCLFCAHHLGNTFCVEHEPDAQLAERSCDSVVISDAFGGDEWRKRTSMEA